MSLKKTMLAVAAAGAITASAVPAMALENEFHGMYRVFGWLTNAETGGGTFNLNKDARDAFFVEQRARVMYIAKANDNLKLVTHFELDARFGGQDTATGTAAANKYPIGDAGALDADRITLETKNIYLDFNVPSTPVNMKVGIQPYNDAYQGVFGNFDAAGVTASSKIGGLTPTIGWFRLADNNFVARSTTAGEVMPGKQSLDLFTADVKYAINKDTSVGVSYYNVQNDMSGATTNAKPTADYQLLHVVGANASANLGPAALSAFAAYEFGDYNNVAEVDAFAASAMAKVAIGPGKLNLAGLYLSGQKDRSAAQTGATATKDMKAWRQLATNGAVSYYAPSNMWLLIRNSSTINSSTAVGGTDLTKGNAGLIGIFGGYELTSGKFFASANVGYAMADEKGTAKDDSIGTEINATVGYKVYDNLTASLSGAYLFLGDGMTKAGTAADRLPGGVANADDPYAVNIQLNYVF